jgi:hypothetical protein
MEDHPDTVGTYANGDIAVLRNGKAKKNDPPIPADLAPISGGGKRRRQESPQEPQSDRLDSIKFRYREETIAEETAIPVEEQAETEENKLPRRKKPRPGKPHGHPGGEAPSGHGDRKKPEHKKPAPKKQEAPTPEENTGDTGNAPTDSSEEKKRPNYRRRPNYHHRRKPKPEGGKPTE